MFEKKGMGWKRLDLTEGAEYTPEPRIMLGVKRYLRKKGLEIRRLPFDIGENVMIFVREKDVPKVQKLLRHRKLEEFI